MIFSKQIDVLNPVAHNNPNKSIAQHEQKNCVSTSHQNLLVLRPRFHELIQNNAAQQAPKRGQSCNNTVFASSLYSIQQHTCLPLSTTLSLATKCNQSSDWLEARGHSCTKSRLLVRQNLIQTPERTELRKRVNVRQFVLPFELIQF